MVKNNKDMNVFKNTKDNYSTLSKIFHWSLALAVISVIIAGNYMTDLPDSDESKFKIYDIHKAVGVIVLFVGVLSILWRWSNVLPVLPRDMNRGLVMLSRLVHYSLYILLLMTPITGVLMSIYGGYAVDVFGLFAIPAKQEPLKEFAGLMHAVHVNLLYFWVFFIGIHVLGAFYHLLFHRDRILQRMLPWGKA